jgi:3-hydroxyisobutyrate dehydrogenase-like beta-hydroxyacid dehydrogenase
VKSVGFIGLGLMGGPMAANLARAGYPLTVYNRSAAKAEPLQALGARVASSPKEVAEASEVVITMLSDAAAVEAVLHGEGGLLAGARQGLTLIDMSTVAPSQSRRIAAELEKCGFKMLDAPVMGSTGPAQAGTLEILVGGEEEVFKAQHDLFEVMGQSAYHLGPQGSGAQAKLSMNLLVAAQVESLSEALVMAVKAGLDLQQVGQIISASNIASNLIKRKVDTIVSGDFQPAFPLKHLHKDLGLMVNTGVEVGVTLPATGVIHQLYNAAMARGHADEDFAAIYRLLAEMAGSSS